MIQSPVQKKRIRFKGFDRNYHVSSHGHSIFSVKQRREYFHFFSYLLYSNCVGKYNANISTFDY